MLFFIIKENEYETIFNNDKKEFLLYKEKEKNELFIDSKIIGDNNKQEKSINNSNKEEN